MESGLNVATSSKKGSRSYIRLYVLKQRLTALSKMFDDRFGLTKITDITEEQLFEFCKRPQSLLALVDEGK